MKTTVELADDLVREAKWYAARHGLTLRAVIEEGIRSTLGRETGARAAFVLRDASVDGSGLQPEFRDEASSRFRDAAYAADQEERRPDGQGPRAPTGMTPTSPGFT